jgi:perosamine synthetase
MKPELGRNGGPRIFALEVDSDLARARPLERLGGSHLFQVACGRSLSGGSSPEVVEMMSIAMNIDPSGFSAVTMQSMLRQAIRKEIAVCTPQVGAAERRYVADCLETNWISSMGEYIPRFERQFAEICGAKHGVACSNGTTALHLALECLGVGAGDEVIIPAFTLIVSANVVCWTGATPVLVDARPDTWCIDERLIEAKITARTKAIMAVHMYGHPCEMDSIRAIARIHGLHVIEDAAQAHGARYRGRRVGALGDVGCFSFYGNKIITTGEGGMLVTNDQRIANRAALLRNQAFGEVRFVHHDVGFNYRMTNIQAAIGCGQCEEFEEKIARKREIAAIYDELLADEIDLQLLARAEGCEPVCWMYGVVLREGFGRSKQEVRSQLACVGVETRSFFIPMNQQPVYQGRNSRWPDLRGSFPVSERLGEGGFYLPSGGNLSRADQEYVVERLLACKR